ncbi:MAG: hypothetical protein H6702_10775 [Myxococcales bacterium]|nr:hypothetical protein [Myxococcales bacterium]
MALRQEVTVGLGGLVLLQVALAVLAIALLGRMGPAVARILDENVRSEAAVEAMLGVLARPAPADAAGFRAALADARANVTEAGERPLLDTVTRHADGALAGDPGARRAAVEALQALGTLNRDSMARADAEAQRLALGGAWGAAILGTLALGLAILFARRLTARLERPLATLLHALSAHQAGHHTVRCPPTPGPAELQAVGRHINRLLDAAKAPAARGAERRPDLHRALGWLLDRQGGACLLEGADGERLAMSAAALADPPSAEALAGWAREPIPGTGLALRRAPGGPGPDQKSAGALTSGT